MGVRPKYPHENDLDRYMMTNKLIGESLPNITRLLREYMSTKDIKMLDSLDNRITIYRGTSMQEVRGEIDDIGQSWTLDITIAQFFAYKHNLNNVDRCVMKATIKKEFIYAYISERNESECVVNSTKLENIKIVEPI